MFCPKCGQQWTAARAFCPSDGERLRATASFESFRSADTGQNGAIVGDRYQVRGFLSKGATARVYLAQDLVTKDPVALKVLASSASPAIHERFLREARTAMSIQHPNVVKIMGAGQRTDGAPYLVMEVMLGETLGDLLRRQGSISVDLGLPLVRQAACGLAAAHRVGVVHRDVKPDNLFLLGEPGEPYALKLLDFGLAKIIEGSSKSVAGTVLGTMEYMSPEQILCDPVDARSDIYGLGVVMFRMLTGHLPFDSWGTDLLAHHLLTPAPPPSWLLEGMDPWIERVILTAMRKHPDNRYPSMDAVVEDLDHAIGLTAGEPTGRPLTRDPDVYVPTTDLGRAAAAMFGEKINITRRSVPP